MDAGCRTRTPDEASANKKNEKLLVVGSVALHKNSCSLSSPAVASLETVAGRRAEHAGCRTAYAGRLKRVCACSIKRTIAIGSFDDRRFVGVVVRARSARRRERRDRCSPRSRRPTRRRARVPGVAPSRAGTRTSSCRQPSGPTRCRSNTVRNRCANRRACRAIEIGEGIARAGRVSSGIRNACGETRSVIAISCENVRASEAESATGCVRANVNGNENGSGANHDGANEAYEWQRSCWRGRCLHATFSWLLRFGKRRWAREQKVYWCAKARGCTV